MIFPNLKEVKEIIKEDNYRYVPITYEIFSDTKTSIEVLKILKNFSKHCFMLESVEDSKRWGRYTFLGFDPTLEITCENEFLKIKGYKSLSKKTKNPSKYIREILQEYKSPNIANLPPFTGGLVGYFSYDYIKYSENRLNLDGEDYESFKDVDLMLFDKIIVFDNFKQKIIFIVNIKVDDLEKEYEKATNELKKLVAIVKNGKSKVNNGLKIKTELSPLFSKEKYCSMVEKAKKHIKEGDIFQVVLSNPISAKIEGSLLNTYRVLRTTNPSPYMFYFSSDDIEIGGASPETLVKLENNTLYTFPLAGTRSRGRDEEEDLKLEKNLLSDEKELAEHNMLVDLARNDLGKVSEFGSIKLEKYMEIKKFSHVMHIGSTVKGTLRKDKDVLDVIEAILPAGTLSGAPKIKACEIIEKLENNKRGIYGGAIGYLGFSGNMDTCIAIRIAFTKKNKVFIRSGAGIVADSVAESEFEECMNKAQAVLNALKLAEKGIE
ncbi:MAG: anthranilate synthase component I [Methanobacteriaceae archaeon]|jgi:anthranilate synthase component 1|nr:anthranilate synthase component I [Candidatus Methanorudis spinitermitis]